MNSNLFEYPVKRIQQNQEKFSLFFFPLFLILCECGFSNSKLFCGWTKRFKMNYLCYVNMSIFLTSFFFDDSLFSNNIVIEIKIEKKMLFNNCGVFDMIQNKLTMHHFHFYLHLFVCFCSLHVFSIDSVSS